MSPSEEASFGISARSCTIEAANASIDGSTFSGTDDECGEFSLRNASEGAGGVLPHQPLQSVRVGEHAPE